MANDVFANIAAKGIGGRMDELIEVTPKKFDKVVFELKDTKNPGIKTKKKMDTKEELYDALAKMRKQYAPFLENHAPSFVDKRIKIDIKDFLCDGEPVTIPHFGGPNGYSKKVYESEFTLDIFDGKAVYIRFLGADYIAVVYVNDVCVGTHEGFFSPFEFEITNVAVCGKNKLRIDLYNDYSFGGNEKSGKERRVGEKFYAATGLGWDEPGVGWHHCPSGTGIYNDVFVEVRNIVHITDIFVRPLPEEEKAEVWIEVQSAQYEPVDVSLDLSVFGQNFKETVIENFRYSPETSVTVGLGDSLTESMIKDSIGKGIPLVCYHGRNLFKVMLDIKNPKLWELDKPYLYQIQANTVVDDKITDTRSQQFGMRSFRQDLESDPKGMFYLNGRKIRLRGANTMGFEQQDVLRGDFEQLIDDILLAKLCNMNFLRITQRPVQDEVYEYCDKLGLMTQCDLPTFGKIGRFKFAEGIKQVEEMEKLVRKHPCNVVDSYINEPMPNAADEPHRYFERKELEDFFAAADLVIKLTNPDRVIKHVDGDYDPPSDCMPDNHCYPMWYNAHGIDIGKLNKGYWLYVKPGWYYGCGEYGAEGLDFPEIMLRRYPKEWVKEPFNPLNIHNAQTGNFYYFFYDKQDSMEDWVEASQTHQAFATQIMTDAFRRDDNMISNAIHLFIDAWPAGWMKTIMDCERNPKKAYFAYRDSLEPVMLSLRTDRFTYYEGEKISIETFICNDTNLDGNYKVVYELYRGDELIKSTVENVSVLDCRATYIGNAEFVIEKVTDREKFTLKVISTDNDENVITYNSIDLEVFEDCEICNNDEVVFVEKLEPGEYEIAGEKVVVKECGMLPLHFASRKTGHVAVSEFMPKDFSYWYDSTEDMITPILYSTFTADGFEPILTSGNMDDAGDWQEVMACGVKEYEGKKYVICQLDLRKENPIAKRFLKNLMKL